MPLREVDRASGAADDEAGRLVIKNMVADVDPDGASGSSNFGSGVEPGYCRPEVPSSTTGTAAAPCNLDVMDTAGNGTTNNVTQSELQIGRDEWSK